MRIALLTVACLCAAVWSHEGPEAVHEDVDDVAAELSTQEDVEEIKYVSPNPYADAYFTEHFDNPAEFEGRWVRSEAKKDGAEDSIGKYDGVWALEAAVKNPLKGDLGLVLKSKAKHAAISAALEKPFYFTTKPLIVQFDVTLQNGQDCGGAYIKLLTKQDGFKLAQFNDKTPYSIMFGPDKCGNDQKLHFIFQHKNPVTGVVSEKHAKKPAAKLDDYFKDGKPHLYTLLVFPDNSFQVSVDYKIVNRGSLLADFSPPVNPPAEIDDPEERKPDDWDEREKIVDADAKKPHDWDEDEPEQIADPDASQPDGWLHDEPEMIADPAAQKPEDWDEEMDGSWEAPLISNPVCLSAPGCGVWKAALVANPKFKGKWWPPMIHNSNYRGKWVPRRIPNPDFFDDQFPFNMAPIGAIGIELWSMSDNILFDNFVITDDMRVSETWARETFDLKVNHGDREKDSVVQRLMSYTSKKPWLWGVYVIVVGIPLVLVYSFCCSTQEKRDLKLAAKAKKTDEAVEDDEGAAEADAAEDEDDQIPALEGSDDDSDNEEDDEENQEEADEADADKKSEEKVAEKSSPRRRRTRKE